MSKFNRYIFSFCLLILVIILIGCSNDSGLSGDYSISGKVINDDNGVLSGVDVILKMKGEEKRVRTDDYGIYQIRSLAAERYKLIFSKEGYYKEVEEGHLKGDLFVDDINLIIAQTDIEGAKRLVSDINDSTRLGLRTKDQLPYIESNFKDEVAPEMKGLGVEMSIMGNVLEEVSDDITRLILNNILNIFSDDWKIDVEEYNATIEVTNLLNIVDVDIFNWKNIRSIDLRRGNFHYKSDFEGVKWDFEFSFNSNEYEVILRDSIEFIVPIDPDIVLLGSLEKEELGEIFFDNELRVDMVEDNIVEFDGIFSSEEFDFEGEFVIGFYDINYDTVDLDIEAELSNINFFGEVSTSLLFLQGNVDLDFSKEYKLPELIYFNGDYSYFGDDLQIELNGEISLNLDFENYYTDLKEFEENYIGGVVTFDGSWKENGIKITKLELEAKRKGLKEYSIDLYYLFNESDYTDAKVRFVDGKINFEAITDKGLRVSFNLDDCANREDIIGEISNPTGEVYAEIVLVYRKIIEIRYKDGYVQSLFF